MFVSLPQSALRQLSRSFSQTPSTRCLSGPLRCGQRLPHDVDTHHLIPALIKAIVTGPGTVSPIDSPLASYWSDGGAGAGRERLVGRVNVVRGEVAFHNWNAEMVREVEESGTGDASKDILVGRSAELAVQDEEKVPQMRFSDIAFAVEHQRNGKGIDERRFMQCNDVVHLIGDFGFGFKRIRGDLRRIDGVTMMHPSM